MFFRKKRCKQHEWVVDSRSNILQLDDMGYPLRLCIIKCICCEETDQIWLDVNTDELKELDTGKSHLIKWY